MECGDLSPLYIKGGDESPHSTASFAGNELQETHSRIGSEIFYVENAVNHRRNARIKEADGFAG